MTNQDKLKLYIKEIYIKNFKIFKEFRLELNEGLNILVGDNEAGKSTLLEAIYLALTGTINGRYLRNDLTPYLFNSEAINEWQKNLQKSGIDHEPPQILIEVIFGGDDIALFEGDGSKSQSGKHQGFFFSVAFNEKYLEEYQALIKSDDIKTLPVEYYNITWCSFARDTGITPKNIPLKPALIDSSTHRYRSGSDIYISQIIKNHLEKEEEVAISQVYRKLKESFRGEDAVNKINKKIKNVAKISDRNIEISVDFSSHNA